MQELVPSADPQLPLSDPAEMRNPVAEAAHHSMQAAQRMFEFIAREAMEFQAALDERTELGAIMVASGMPKTIHVRQIRFQNPDIIVFSGLDHEGNPVRLLQHYTMVSIAFVSVRVLSEKPYRVGFLEFPGKAAEG